jgi:hypothetical protein
MPMWPHVLTRIVTAVALFGALLGVALIVRAAPPDAGPPPIPLPFPVPQPPRCGAKGWLDLDSNAACRIDNVNIENVIYSPGVAVTRGTYVVRVNYYQNCSASSPVPFEVEVRASSDARPEPADVVVANILSSPLKLLAPMLTDLVKPGGMLVISGVLERQIDEVSAAYAPRLALAVAGLADGWACLTATKPR